MPAPSGRIIAIGDAGNDSMVLTAVTRPVWLYGEGGNDVLMAGSDGSLLFSGDGNDQLFGSSGRDILIGGESADNLFGSGSDDILIAGLTNYDSRSVAGHEEFWCDVWSEWHSTNSFAARVQNLRDGTGGSANTYGSFLQPNVGDDLMTGSVDMLVGGAGSDWILSPAGKDLVADPAEASNERQRPDHETTNHGKAPTKGRSDPTPSCPRPKSTNHWRLATDLPPPQSIRGKISLPPALRLQHFTCRWCTLAGASRVSLHVSRYLLRRIWYAQGSRSVRCYRMRLGRIGDDVGRTRKDFH